MAETISSTVTVRYMALAMGSRMVLKPGGMAHFGLEEWADGRVIGTTVKNGQAMALMGSNRHCNCGMRQVTLIDKTKVINKETDPGEKRSLEKSHGAKNRRGGKTR